MKITLINPFGEKSYFEQYSATLPPLGLLYIAAALEKEKHEISVIDAELFALSPKEVVARIPPDTGIVGLGGTTSQARGAYQIATLVKKTFPSCVTTYGGPHACAIKSEVFSTCKDIDYVILGAGEIPMVELAAGKSPLTIKGVMNHNVSDEEAVFATPIPIDELPFPARHLLPISAYVGAGRVPFTQTIMMVTRGCPFKCIFCSSSVWGKIWDKRSIDSIIEELRAVEKLGFDEVFFQDDTMNVNVPWVEQLCQRIRAGKFKMSFKLCLRANEKLLPERLVKLLAEANIDHVFFGVESGNDTIRANAAKGLSTAEIKRAVKLCKKYGIATTCSFIVGLPGETAETVEESIAFIRETRPYEAGFGIATPFPGSPFRKWAIDNGYLENPSYENLSISTAVTRTKSLNSSDLVRLTNYANSAASRYISKSQSDQETAASMSLMKLTQAKLRGDIVSQRAILRWIPSFFPNQPHEVIKNFPQAFRGDDVSNYVKVHAAARLAAAYFQIDDPESALPHLQLVATNGDAIARAWCDRLCHENGWNGSPFLPPPANNAEPPSQQALARFITSSIDSSSVFQQNILRSIRTEADLFTRLMSLKQNASPSTRLIFLESFGPSEADFFYYPKNLSKWRFLDIAGICGWENAGKDEGCLLLSQALIADTPQEEINPDNFIMLRARSENQEQRDEIILKTETQLRSILANAPTRVKAALLSAISNNTDFHPILRDAIQDVFQVKSPKPGLASAIAQKHPDTYAAALVDYAKLEGARVLEIGCGNGALVQSLRNLGVMAYGTDTRHQAITKSIKKVRKYLRNVTATPESLKELFKDNSFEAIVFSAGWERVPNNIKDAWSRTIFTLLRPGGYLFAPCPTEDHSVADSPGDTRFRAPGNRHPLLAQEIVSAATAMGYENITIEFSKHIMTLTNRKEPSLWDNYAISCVFFCFAKPGQRASLETPFRQPPQLTAPGDDNENDQISFTSETDCLGDENKLRAFLERIPPYALYGAGSCARTFLDIITPLDLPKPTMILDSKPLMENMLDIPIKKPSPELLREFTNIILATDTWQDQMKSEIARIFGLKAQVFEVFPPRTVIPPHKTTKRKRHRV